MFGNHLINAQQEREFRRELSAIASSARTAYNDTSFDGHQAMPAIIAHDDVIYDNQSTPLTQRGGGEKISAFTQTEQIEMVEISTQPMVEMSTQTEEEEESILFDKSLSTQTEDRQENKMDSPSGDTIAPVQESGTIIQILQFRDDIVRMTIRQEDQRVLSFENISYGNVLQSQQQDPQDNMDSVSTVDDGEIDRKDMPDLLNDKSADILESEVFKEDFLSTSDYSRAPKGPFKEEPIDDSSQSMLTMKMVAGQDELNESGVTHWQEHTMQARPQDSSRSGMRQIRRDNVFRHDLSKPRQVWQNGKAEKCHEEFWVSPCSAKAGAHTA